MKSFVSLAVAFAAAVNAGSVLWDGSFDYFSTAADFDKWSWSNQVGPYQWYIHGSSATSNYLALSPSYKNPAITRESKGLKLTIDSTSHWNGQSFWRTELIPQTTSNLGSGRLYYHFTLKRTDTNPPRSTYEHQVVFFESHFTELKFGVAPDPTKLQWCIGGQPKWSTSFDANTYYNFAYDIDFASSKVGLYFSTGSNPLQQVVAPQSASTSTNSADWHLGVLAFASGSVVEDWYFSGVYVEQGPITTAIGSGTTPVTTTQGGVTTTKPVTITDSVPRVSSTTTTSTTTTSTTSGPVQTQWGQCAGIGYTGPTQCASPFKCVAVSPPYYSQCQ
ncbi:hypothetical protein FRC02_008673 [Tulasnella sp. 418]|nr:hypothetical protein FRC02_008673 [Tulasnella sp. 418]